MWEIEVSDEFEAWWRELDLDQQELLDQRLRLLSDQGPGLGRPAVDTLVGSNLANLKELRAGIIRVLFAFDPRRTAICCSAVTSAVSGVAGTSKPSQQQSASMHVT